MKRIALLIFALILIVPLAGCSAINSMMATETPTATATVEMTEIPLPTESATFTPTVTSTPKPTPTPKPVNAVPAEVVFDTYILRTGPGRLYNRIALYDTGEPISIIGREPGNNWVLVITSDNRSGWMNTAGLTIVGELDSVPVFAIPDSKTLYGHVYNTDGSPAELITVTIVPLDEDNPEKQNTAVTNENGEFYIYLPDNATGEWVIGPNAYGCPGDPTGGCTLQGNLPEARQITLPMDNNVAIEFRITP